MLIQRMRDGSEGVLAKIIIGLIIIVFGLFGFGSITTFLAPVPKVATVNGEDITQSSMEMAVERNRRILMANNVAQENIDEDQLRADALNRLVTRELLTQSVDDLDLFYGDQAIDAELVQQEVFQIDGVFNADQFQRIIRSAGYSPISYREEMRTDKRLEQLLSGLEGSAFLTAPEAERFNSLFSQARDIAYLQMSVGDIALETTVSDEEIADYYSANPESFLTDETVVIEYVELNRDELIAGIDVDEESLRIYFEENMGRYGQDEQRRFAHILVEVSDEGSEAEAEAEANEIHGRILDGEDFTALAMELSDDFGSRETGGDLGFNTQGTFFPEFEAVAYDLDLNQVSEPVRTSVGYHIIKVLEIEEAVVPTLDDIRLEVEQAYRYAETEDEFITLSSRLAEMLFESDLEIAANELGLEIIKTKALARDAGEFPMTDNQVVAAAFSTDVLLDGNNSDLIELNDDQHIGLRVAEHNPSLSKPLAEVSEDIRYILQTLKAQETAESRSEEIVASIESGSLAQFVADQYGLEWVILPKATRTQTEVDPQILREAFKLPRPAEAKESLGITTLPNGDSVVLRVSLVHEAPSDEVDETQLALIQSSFARQSGQVDFQEYEDALRKSASIDGVREEN